MEINKQSLLMTTTKKSAEFRQWIIETRLNIRIEDLETEESKQLFASTFVKDWNEGRLEPKFYKGIPPEAIEASSRTKYKWKFAEKLDPVEMGNLRETVQKLTNPEQKNLAAESQDLLFVLPSQGPKKPELDTFQKEEQEAFKKWESKKTTKDFKKLKDTVEEELVPKKTGREAMQENKKKKAEYTKDRKDENIDTELKDSDIYGASDIRTRMQKQKNAQEEKIAAKMGEQQAKMNEYRRKETEKMAPFLALLQSGNVPLLQHKGNH